MKILYLTIITIILISFGCNKVSSSDMMNSKADFKIPDNAKVATLAGGCFWCLESPFEKLDGVYEVISGYSGGEIKNPTYKQVASGRKKYVESVQVFFDPKIISYSEIIDLYWKQFDPTDAGGSFHDRGYQYTSVIFYHDEDQKEVAEESKKQLNNSALFNNKIATRIEKFTNFYEAEEYHQDYYLKSSSRYNNYRQASGRDDFIAVNWGELNKQDEKDKSELKKRLTKLQYYVTQENGTEKAFENKYWDNDKVGIYVDIVDQTALFSSKDKYKSGTGWPSFTKVIDIRNVVKKIDNSYSMIRTEVRSKFADSHLGHLFDDGPEPTNLRYCINSASLRFIPFEEMEEEGYEDYLWIFIE